VKVIVPARFTPLGEPVFVNLTDTVQEAPGARFVPVQVSGPASGPFEKKKVVSVPPAATTLVIATEEVPAVFLRVTVPVPVIVPVGKVMVSGFGEIVTVALFATPEPLSGTGVGVTITPAVV
jgi:hypothetical protein